MTDHNLFLTKSPYAEDGGEFIGIDPRKITADDLRRLGHPESPAKAIRAKCIECSEGSQTEVRKCVRTACALWPYRMGKNPFRTRTLTDEQKAALSERMTKIREIGEDADDDEE